MDKAYELVTPGEIIIEEFLKPLTVDSTTLADAMKLPLVTVENILHHRAPITMDTAMRLSTVFSTSYNFWINLQNNYDHQMLYRNFVDHVKSDLKPLIKDTD